MKKSVLFTIAAIVLVLGLTSCGGSSVEETTKDAPAGRTEQADSEKFIFTYKGHEIYMGQDAAIIDSLGEYKEYTEEPSCAFEGVDKSYFYGSFYLVTGTLGGKEMVVNLWFVDDTVETAEGLCIGDGKDKVESLYGADGLSSANAYIYKKEHSALTVIMENDVVSSIQYSYEN
ncbi:MAG: hypothetical protein ACOX75_02845 [Lachnospiraceae bacterium]|jgi:hypothetical protein